MEDKEKIIDSFNDFFSSKTQLKKDEKDIKELTLSEKFDKERLEYSVKIKNMSAKFKDVFKVAELMTVLYTERQLCVDYHHYLINLLIKLNKVYKTKYSEKWEYYTFKSQKRYPNEAEKKTKILVDLKEIVEKRALIDNHSVFLLDTTKTIDNLIYGVKYRIEIEQISRGK